MTKQYITYELTKKDSLFIGRYLYKKVGPGKKSKLVYVLILFVLIMIVSGYNHEYSLAVNIRAKVLIFLVFFLCYKIVVFLFLRIFFWFYFRSEKICKGIVGQYTMTVSEEGVLEERSFNKTLHTWDGICEIEMNDEYVIMLASATQGYFVPTRAFSCKTEAQDFFETVKSYKEKS